MSDHEKHFEAGKELQNELKKLFRTADPVPPEVDRKILEMADKHFAEQRKTGRVVILRWAGRVAAAAAIILVTAILYVQFESKTTHYKTGLDKFAAVVGESINPAAKVTILDAFTLARNIDAGKKIEKSWDLNGDGIIDKRDVDAVAFAAVRLHDGVAL
jgi:hypothetical protein